jgi:hypothetical protein
MKKRQGDHERGKSKNGSKSHEKLLPSVLSTIQFWNVASDSD